MRLFKVFALASAVVLMVACDFPVIEGSKEVKALYPNKTQKDSISYLLGINFASWAKSASFKDINYDEMVKGIKDWMNAKGTPQDPDFFEQFKVDPNNMEDILQAYVKKMSAYLGALNSEKGEQYIREFLLEEGTQITDSGLAYRIIEPGNDKRPVSDQDTVWVNYKGSLMDNTVFDENEGVHFALEDVISGWAEGIKLIGEGGKITLVVPPHLAYGENGNRAIEPNTTLLFDVELLEVHPF